MMNFQTAEELDETGFDHFVVSTTVLENQVIEIIFAEDIHNKQY